MMRRVSCDECSAEACVRASTTTLCLKHLYTVGGFGRVKWKVLSRTAIENQRQDLERAFQEAYGEASKALGNRAAERVLSHNDDDPLAALIDDSKRRAEVKTTQPQKKAPRREPQRKKDDLTGRKRTRPTMMWATTDEEPQEMMDTEPSFPRGEPCPRCGEIETQIRPRGGGNCHSGKVETWGRKDEDLDLAYETRCPTCDHVWRSSN